MTKIFIKTLSILLCAALLTTSVNAFSTSVSVPDPDLTFTDGSLTVELKYTYKDSASNNITLNLKNINISVCKVAEMESVNGLMRYKLIGGFIGAVTPWPEYMDRQDESGRTLISREELGELAKKLYAHAVNNHIARDMKTSDADGKVLFTGLTAGLYLVAQENESIAEYKISPTLVPIPLLIGEAWINGVWTGTWSKEVTVKPKTEPNVKPTATPRPSNSPSGTPYTAYSPPQDDPVVKYPIPQAPNREIYLELGNDVPDGKWTPNVGGEELILDEIPPVGKLPHTSVLRWPIPILFTLGGLTAILGLVILLREKRREKKKV